MTEIYHNAPVLANSKVDLSPEKDISYNLIKRGDEWSKNDLQWNRSSISFARRKLS
jgi:hypothetical protein